MICAWMFTSSAEIGSSATTKSGPSAMNPPSGCRFRTRCPVAEERCAVEMPPLLPAADGQLVACHFPGRI
ncbi:MAG: hypothetical protein J0H19_05405 [Rhodospirillales bacterium]|nr:hypothetical protein [Rhodospirillales bacterium]